MGDSTGWVGPDHSWSASPCRTLAEVSARGVSGRIEAMAASSRTGTSGSLAAERENPFKRAFRSHDGGGLEASVAALAAVGTVDGPEVQVLKESLQKARRATQERPINAMLSQTEAFVERARKRLQAHDAARQQLVQELEEGEGRTRGSNRHSDAGPITATNALVEELHGSVERPQVRQRVSPSHIPEVIPPMLTLIPHELGNWILDRQSD